MALNTDILKDSFGRNHNYLRISLTEKCNLRCTYCMPAEGVPLSPSPALMTADEIYEIAKVFVANGVDKIRLTGGEPLVRKDFTTIIEKLSTLDVSIAMTTNAVNIDRYISELKKSKVSIINVSLDTLIADRFQEMTLKPNFEKVIKNLYLLIDEGFQIKLNVVLLKGTNDSEILDFIELTKELPISIRFIEFMPFDGNRWDRSKAVSLEEINQLVNESYPKDSVLKIEDAPNDTAKNYKIKGFKGSFAIISTVTNPFCDSCNRLRLTANGKLRNCLFSEKESDLLTAHRNGESIEPIIQKAVLAKAAVRAGLDTNEKFADPNHHSKNRSMITIGG
ncbi:MAG: GTP 3',8-cyclase MoaA [Flavobacteriaceae bacterium]|nr:GTP 3',8-cyclase MoaA [Flavobacteriaceae bacterium]NVJ72763.1 GTP 3',8-cyclase MoaA [Flavobacteriaceae bacterium]